MKNPKEPFDQHKIAKLLFLINLPLGILSVIVMLVFMVKVVTDMPEHVTFSTQVVYFGSLLIVGFIAEVIYYRQGRYQQLANNKWLWYYSIAVQLIFIASELFTGQQMAIFTIYPITFCALSCVSLVKIGANSAIHNMP